jgi:hypothetical protein
VAASVQQNASERDDAIQELVDLHDFPLPHLEEPIPSPVRPLRSPGPSRP